MSEYIQVGATAMRDPITGDFLPSVPLYVRADDQKTVDAPVFDDAAIRMLADKWKQYVQASRREKKKTR